MFYLKVTEELKQHLAGKPVAAIFDETPDVEGRCRDRVSGAVQPFTSFHGCGENVYKTTISPSLFPNSLHITWIGSHRESDRECFSRKPFDQLNAFMLLQYHSEQSGLYKGFVEMEIQVCGSKCTTVWRETLHEMLRDQELVQSLEIQLNHHGKSHPAASRHLPEPCGIKEDLQMNIAANKEL
ncbi:unnamed protein product, partial [Coregonus sp. 'balchen']